MPSAVRFRRRLVIALAGLAVLASSGAAVGLPNVRAVGPSLAFGSDPAGILAGKQVRGMVSSDRPTPPEVALRDIGRMRNLGINTVAVYIYVDADSLTANGVHDGPNTYSDARLAAITDLIHARNMAVMWVPYIVIRERGAWHGNLRPTNPDLFFKSYSNLMNKYATLAQKYKVEIFSVGTELSALQNPQHYSRWGSLTSQVNARYTGLTTYISASFSFASMNWWNFVDVMGISPYYSLSAGPPNGPKAAPVNQLVSTWRNTYLPEIAATSARFGNKKVLFGEIGYQSIDYATAKPATAWKQGANLKVNEQAQANGYEALLQATKGVPWFRGVVWFFWGEPKARNNAAYTPRGKLAECVLKAHWSPGSLRPRC